MGQEGLTCGPLPLGYVGTPSLPVSSALAVGSETLFLLAEVLLVLNEDHGGRVGGRRVRGKLRRKNSNEVLQGANSGVGGDSQGVDKQCSDRRPRMTV
jgi:hypothetical protein